MTPTGHVETSKTDYPVSQRHIPKKKKTETATIRYESLKPHKGRDGAAA